MVIFKDVVHLYFGCAVNLLGNHNDTIHNKEKVFILKGIIKIDAEETFYYCDSNECHHKVSIGEIVPLLRERTDMTDEEAFTMLTYNNVYPLMFEGFTEGHRFLQYRKIFPKRKSKIFYEMLPVFPHTPMAFKYALRQEFDLFDLITNKLAKEVSRGIKKYQEVLSQNYFK